MNTKDHFPEQTNAGDPYETTRSGGDRREIHDRRDRRDRRGRRRGAVRQRVRVVGEWLRDLDWLLILALYVPLAILLASILTSPIGAQSARDSAVARQLDSLANVLRSPLTPPDSSGGSVPLPTCNAAPIDTARFVTEYRIELPRVFLRQCYPKVVRTLPVAKGSPLQPVLDSARVGDEIVLESGGVWTGNFVFPAKPDTGWIVLRSSMVDSLAPPNTRIDTTRAQTFAAKIVTANTQPALRWQLRASGWWISGIEASLAPSVTAAQYGIVALGEYAQVDSTAIPANIVLDRMWIHGADSSNLIRAVALNSRSTTLQHGVITNVHAKGNGDTQAIGMGAGPGPYRVYDMVLSAAGENILIGGNDPRISGLTPSDIEVDRSYFYTPASWKGVWPRKNLFELKNARRVLLSNSVLSGSWADAQVGYALIFKATNQAGQCLWCTTRDVVVRDVHIIGAGAGITVAGREGSNQNPLDSLARRMAFQNVVMDSLRTPPFTGEGKQLQILENVKEVVFDRVVSSGQNLLSAIAFRTVDSLVLNDLVLPYGQYGLKADGQNPGGPSYAKMTNTVWGRVTFLRSTPVAGYPAGTVFVASELLAPVADSIRVRVAKQTAGVR